MDELNATQGSLLGFLHDEPKTGWDLVRRSRPASAGSGTSPPATSTASCAGSRRRAWSPPARPGPGNAARSPSPPPAGGPSSGGSRSHPARSRSGSRCSSLWFTRHLDPDRLEGFFEGTAKDHESRLAFYRDVERTLDEEDHRTAVVRFGIAYERAVPNGRPDGRTPGRLPARPGTGLDPGRRAEPTDPSSGSRQR